MITVIAVLKIKDSAAFHEFESQAIAFLKDFGASLLHCYPVDNNANHLDAEEIHILSFPDEESLSRYQANPALLALADLRVKAISSTKIYIASSEKQYS